MFTKANKPKMYPCRKKEMDIHCPDCLDHFSECAKMKSYLGNLEKIKQLLTLKQILMLNNRILNVSIGETQKEMSGYPLMSIFPTLTIETKNTIITLTLETCDIQYKKKRCCGKHV